MPRTRIVCTLGPATSSEERIRALIHAGMNVARINFSHGGTEDHLRQVELVRRVAEQEKAVVAILGDLSGPKLRVGQIPGGTLLLRPGETISFAPTDRANGSAIPLDFPFLGNTLRAGDRMLLDDGTKELEVLRADPQQIRACVITGGELRSRKGVNLPNVALPIPSLTEQDRVKAEWSIAQGFDYLALSFVRQAADVVELRRFLTERNSKIPIVSKIEKPEAVQNMDAILAESDGVMVARGDLGVEMPAEQVPIYQKLIIDKANQLGIPVITATQMLESMIQNPNPTRAEASDVANAVLDGSDALMLSGETAVGNYPVEAVQAMARIADFAEQSLQAHLVSWAMLKGRMLTVTDAIGKKTVELARELEAKLIITLTFSGYTARMVARHRPQVPILAVTTQDAVRRRLALVWGIESCSIDEGRDGAHAVEAALQAALDEGLGKPGDRVVLTAGVPAGISGQTNMVQVRNL